MRISLYQNIKNTTPKVGSKCVFKVLDSIKNGTYKSVVAKIRIETDKEKRNQLKSKLHYVTFCGTFTTRSNTNLKKASGLACLDFDEVDDLPKLIDNVNLDKYTFASFVSPSGNGLKVLVKIPFVDNNDDYHDFYVEVQKHYNQYGKTDDATKAIANACYLSFDENLYQNADSVVFTDKYNKPLPKPKKVINIPITDKNVVADKLEVWFKKRWSNTNRNNNLHAYARQMNAFGVDKAICEQYLLRYEMNDFKEKEIKALINSAYKYTDEHNTQFFEDSIKVKSVKNYLIAGEDRSKIKVKIKGVPDEALDNEIKRHQDTLQQDEFWYYTDKGGIKLATFRFLNYLESNNISKYYPDDVSDTYLFIKTENKFLKEFGESKIKDYTLTDLRKRGQIDAFELMANSTQNFSSRYLSMIKTTNIVINRDTKNASYIYYRNGVVKTTKSKISLIDYKDIDGLIWQNQVIDRDVVLKNESEGEFKEFIWNISKKDVQRYFTLKSVIGYLMHSFQNESKPKAIIFNDEMIGEDLPNGGSGKGLIHKAIGHIKKITIEDGKKFDPRSQFAYQKVNKDTQNLLLDDVPKNFNFESLFSIITEGMTIEKKGKDAYHIPFNESPKISITTNYTVKGGGASFYRRVFEVEIANHYNEHKTPEDDFGHQFFTEWDKDEWAKFDNFMVRCIKYFLNNGLVESEKVNLPFRKLNDDCGIEFLEFMDQQNFDGVPIPRKELRDKFNVSYPTLVKYNGARQFHKKVKDYCGYYEINLKEDKHNGKMCFYMDKKDINTEDEVPF